MKRKPATTRRYPRSFQFLREDLFSDYIEVFGTLIFCEMLHLFSTEEPHREKKSSVQQ